MLRAKIREKIKKESEISHDEKDFLVSDDLDELLEEDNGQPPQPLADMPLNSAENSSGGIAEVPSGKTGKISFADSLQRGVALDDIIENIFWEKEPEFKEYLRLGYNLNGLDRDALSRLEGILHAHVPEAGQQLIISDAKEFLHKITTLVLPSEISPELQQHLSQVNTMTTTLCLALEALDLAGTVNSRVAAEDYAVSHQLHVLAGEAKKALPTDTLLTVSDKGHISTRTDAGGQLHGESNDPMTSHPGFKKLTGSLLAEDRLMRRRLAGYLDSTADQLHEAGRRSREYARGNLAALHDPSRPSARRALSLIDRISFAIRIPCEALEKVAGTLRHQAAALRPVQEESPEAGTDLWEDTVAFSKRFHENQRDRVRGYATLAHNVGLKLKKEAGKARPHLGLQPAIYSAGVKNAVKETGLLLLEELHQIERRLMLLPAEAWTLQEAVEQRQSLLAPLKHASALPVLDTLLAQQREREVVRWQVKIARAEEKLTTLLTPITFFAEEKRANDFYYQLSTVLHQVPLEKGEWRGIGQIEEMITAVVNKFSRIACDVNASVLRLAGHGHSGGVDLHKNIRDWLQDLDRIKKQIDAKVATIAGESPGYYSRAGMLARGMAEWAEGLKQDYLRETMPEDRSAAGADFERALLGLVKKHSFVFRKKSDPEAKIFQLRLERELQHAAQGTTTYPQTPEEILAGSRSLENDLKRWAQKRVVSGAISAALSQGFKLVSGPLSLSGRIVMRSIRTGHALYKGLKEMDRGVRLGQGPAGRLKAQFIRNQLSRAGVRFTLSISPLTGWGISAAITGTRLYREDNYAKTLVTENLHELPEDLLSRGGFFTGASIFNRVFRLSAEEVLAKLVALHERDNRSLTTQEIEENIGERFNIAGDPEFCAAVHQHLVEIQKKPAGRALIRALKNRVVDILPSHEGDLLKTEQGVQGYYTPRAEDNTIYFDPYNTVYGKNEAEYPEASRHVTPDTVLFYKLLHILRKDIDYDKIVSSMGYWRGESDYSGENDTSQRRDSAERERDSNRNDMDIPRAFDGSMDSDKAGKRVKRRAIDDDNSMVDSSEQDNGQAGVDPEIHDLSTEEVEEIIRFSIKQEAGEKYNIDQGRENIFLLEQYLSQIKQEVRNTGVSNNEGRRYVEGVLNDFVLINREIWYIENVSRDGNKAIIYPDRTNRNNYLRIKKPHESERWWGIDPEYNKMDSFISEDLIRAAAATKYSNDFGLMSIVDEAIGIALDSNNLSYSDYLFLRRNLLKVLIFKNRTNLEIAAVLSRELSYTEDSIKSIIGPEYKSDNNVLRHFGLKYPEGQDYIFNDDIYPGNYSSLKILSSEINYDDIDLDAYEQAVKDHYGYGNPRFKALARVNEKISARSRRLDEIQTMLDRIIEEDDRRRQPIYPWARFYEGLTAKKPNERRGLADDDGGQYKYNDWKGLAEKWETSGKIQDHISQDSYHFFFAKIPNSISPLGKKVVRVSEKTYEDPSFSVLREKFDLLCELKMLSEGKKEIERSLINNKSKMYLRAINTLKNHREIGLVRNEPHDDNLPAYAESLNLKIKLFHINQSVFYFELFDKYKDLINKVNLPPSEHDISDIIRSRIEALKIYKQAKGEVTDGLTDKDLENEFIEISSKRDDALIEVDFIAALIFYIHNFNTKYDPHFAIGIDSPRIYYFYKQKNRDYLNELYGEAVDEPYEYIRSQFFMPGKQYNGDKQRFFDQFTKYKKDGSLKYESNLLSTAALKNLDIPIDQLLALPKSVNYYYTDSDIVFDPSKNKYEVVKKSDKLKLICMIELSDGGYVFIDDVIKSPSLIYISRNDMENKFPGFIAKKNNDFKSENKKGRNKAYFKQVGHLYLDSKYPAREVEEVDDTFFFFQDHNDFIIDENLGDLSNKKISYIVNKTYENFLTHNSDLKKNALDYNTPLQWLYYNFIPFAKQIDYSKFDPYHNVDTASIALDVIGVVTIFISALGPSFKITEELSNKIKQVILEGLKSGMGKNALLQKVIAGVSVISGDVALQSTKLAARVAYALVEPVPVYTAYRAGKKLLSVAKPLVKNSLSSGKSFLQADTQSSRPQMKTGTQETSSLSVSGHGPEKSLHVTDNNKPFPVSGNMSNNRVAHPFSFGGHNFLGRNYNNIIEVSHDGGITWTKGGNLQRFAFVMQNAGGKSQWPEGGRSETNTLSGGYSSGLSESGSSGTDFSSAGTSTGSVNTAEQNFTQHLKNGEEPEAYLQNLRNKVPDENVRFFEYFGDNVTGRVRGGNFEISKDRGRTWSKGSWLQEAYWRFRSSKELSTKHLDQRIDHASKQEGASSYTNICYGTAIRNAAQAEVIDANQTDWLLNKVAKRDSKGEVMGSDLYQQAFGLKKQPLTTFESAKATESGFLHVGERRPDGSVIYDHVAYLHITKEGQYLYQANGADFLLALNGSELMSTYNNIGKHVSKSHFKHKMDQEKIALFDDYFSKQESDGSQAVFVFTPASEVQENYVKQTHSREVERSAVSEAAAHSLNHDSNKGVALNSREPLLAESTHKDLSPAESQLIQETESMLRSNLGAEYSTYILMPKENCANAATGVRHILKQNAFTDVKLVEVGIWPNGGTTAPTNHYVVMAKKGDVDVVVDLTAGQFEQYGFTGPVITTKNNWIFGWQQAMKSKPRTLVKMAPLSGGFTTSPFSAMSPYVDSRSTVPGGALIQSPGWYQNIDMSVSPGEQKHYPLRLESTERNGNASNNQDASPGGRQENAALSQQSGSFYRPFGPDSYIEMGPNNNTVIVRAHGAPGDTGNYTAEGVATVIRSYLHARNIDITEVRFIELQSCYGNTCGPFSQAQAIANNLGVKVKGYSGKFTEQRGSDPHDGSFSKPYKNPVAVAVSGVGNAAFYHVSEATLAVRRRLGVGNASSAQAGSARTYPVAGRSAHRSRAGRRRQVVIPNSFEVLRLGGAAEETNTHMARGSHLSSTRPVTDTYGQVILQAIREIPPRSKAKAGVLIGGMLVLGSVGIAGWKHESDRQNALASLEDLEENLSAVGELKNAEDKDLQTIMQHCFGDENISSEDIQQIITFIRKVRTTATDEELKAFSSGMLPARFSKEVPDVIERVSTEHLLCFYMQIFGEKPLSGAESALP